MSINLIKIIFILFINILFTTTIKAAEFTIKLAAELTAKSVAESASYKVFQAQCVDFLEKLNLKPPHLIFDKCTIRSGGPGFIASATYRVKGIYAKSVEQFLDEKTNMGKLVFACCVWMGWTLPGDNMLTGRGIIENPVNPEFRYSVHMRTTGESGGIYEENWDKIDYFYVTVEVELEGP